jgi:2-C-methyl-D-erythritol 4-phosphate cytidylyltransferase
VLAGGSGSRVGAGLNKVYLPLAGLRVVSWSLRWVHAVDGIGPVVLVVRPEDEDLAVETLERDAPGQQVAVVRGGATRHESEHNALRHLAPAIRVGSVDVVAIHDGARPIAGPAIFRRVIDAARESGGAIPALPATDVVAASTGVGTEVPIRAQTPQAFRAAALLEAFESATRDGYEGSDTAGTVERYTEVPIRCVPGDPRNIKITFAQDLRLADRLLQPEQACSGGTGQRG